MNYCSICGRYTSVKGIIRPVVVFDRGRMKRRLRKMYFALHAERLTRAGLYTQSLGELMERNEPNKSV